MIKKILFSLLLFFYVVKAFATNIHGGQVTYQYMGSDKFEVTYKVYRDCRGLSLSVPNYTIRCSSTSATKTLTATLVSVVDITPVCAGAITNCKSSTFTAKGYEELTYRDTLDFNGNESAFKSCCIIQIGVGRCCRPADITTGASSNDFWVFSTLDLCKAPTNSSPVFTFKPIFIESASTSIRLSYSAKDTMNNDSLSYSFADPLQTWAQKTNWTGNFDSKNPLTPYYPLNYDKSKGPRPDLNPPYGITLDPLTGNFVATGTNSSEVTIIAVSVKEWRKDNNGKYIQVGEIVMDHTFYITTATNHKPVISLKTDHKVCEGQTITLNIPTDDQPFTMPPPASTIHNDTVTFTWDKNIKNANYGISTPNIKYPEGKFEWTPATGDSKKTPFSFSAIATDNNCPHRGITIRTFKLFVYPIITVTSSIKKISNTTYTAGINISNKTYNYVAGKGVTSLIAPDIRNYYFKSTGTPYSGSEKDTIIFKRNGTYILSNSFISETECNTKIIYDTLVIANLTEVMLENNSSGNYTDTAFCKNQMARIHAQVTNAKRPVTYSWKTKTKTLTDTLGYFDQAFSVQDTIHLSIKDANGQTNSTFRGVKILEVPSISAGTDKIACPGVTLKVKAKNLNKDTLTWEWRMGGSKISSADSVVLTTQGNYIIAGTNKKGCTAYDTATFVNYNPVKIDLISGTYCQSKNELVQSEIFAADPNLQFKEISWALLRSLPNSKGVPNFLSDILKDMDPTVKYNYKIVFEDPKIALSGNKDSLRLRAIATDTNGCKSTDEISVVLIKKPTITLVSDTVNLCINKSIDLNLSGSATGTYNWIPFSSNGSGVWPSYQPIAGDTLASNYFKSPGYYKISLQAIFESCSNNDSLMINVLPLSKALVSITRQNGMVRFKDHTSNIISRKWFVNNSFFALTDTFLVSEGFVNIQPVKLEITNSEGCTTDTVMYLKFGTTGKIKNSEIRIYPNPAGSVLILDQPAKWVPSNFEIYDVMGKMVINGVTKQKEEMIDLQSVKPGVYYLKYFMSGDIISLPFIHSE